MSTEEHQSSSAPGEFHLPCREDEALRIGLTILAAIRQVGPGAYFQFFPPGNQSRITVLCSDRIDKNVLDGDILMLELATAGRAMASEVLALPASEAEHLRPAA